MTYKTLNFLAFPKLRPKINFATVLVFEVFWPY